MTSGVAHHQGVADPQLTSRASADCNDVASADTNGKDEASERAGGRDLVRANVPLSSVLKKVLPASVLLIAVFWANMCHLYGAFYRQNAYTHQAHVAVVDFDQGPMGSMLLGAASSLSGTDGYPTYNALDAASWTPESLREAVFNGHYWSAIYATSGASERWYAAVNGSDTSPYDSTNTLAYITMTGRYFSMYQSFIFLNDVIVTQATAAAFREAVVVPALEGASTASLTSSAVNAISNPITAEDVFAAEDDFTIYPRALLNTVGVVMPILMQFFFIMAFNGISNSLHLFASRSMRSHHNARNIATLVWPLISSLCVVGWAWTFKGSQYPLPAWSFFAAWAVTYVLCIINFSLIVITTTYIEIGFVPPIFLTWIICNVVGSLVPVELAHPWYRVNYFFPSLHWWQVMTTALTQGGVSHLKYNLPTLAGWLIVAFVGSIFATTRKVKDGRIAFSAAINLPGGLPSTAEAKARH